MARSGARRIVRHRIAEGLKFLVGGMQFGGALDDLAVQVRIQAEDIFLDAFTLGDVLERAPYLDDLAVLQDGLADGSHPLVIALGSGYLQFQIVGLGMFYRILDGGFDYFPGPITIESYACFHIGWVFWIHVVNSGHLIRPCSFQCPGIELPSAYFGHRAYHGQQFILLLERLFRAHSLGLARLQGTGHVVQTLG